MNRRRFLAATTAAAGSALLPARADARLLHSVRASEARLPKLYAPMDAQPYYHPATLVADQIDAEIWPAVKRINESGWVWTLESCEGHAGAAAWSNDPLIRLAVHHGLAARMLGLLHRAAPAPARGTKDTSAKTATRITVYRHVAPPMPGWFEARVVISGRDGIATFERFAETIQGS